MHGHGEGDDVTRSSQNVGAGRRLRAERGREQRRSGEDSKGRAGKGTRRGQGTWTWKERVGRKGGGKKENGGR